MNRVSQFQSVIDERRRWNGTRIKLLLFLEKYKDSIIKKIQKQDAWVDLTSLLETEMETSKKKITSLLASLRREKQKIKNTGTGKGQYL